MDEWCVSGHKVYKAQVVFFAQVILVYVVVVASIINISLGVGDRNLWIVLLSSSFGYLLPSPSLRDGRVLPPSAQQHAQGSIISP